VLSFFSYFLVKQRERERGESMFEREEEEEKKAKDSFLEVLFKLKHIKKIATFA